MAMNVKTGLMRAGQCIAAMVAVTVVVAAEAKPIIIFNEDADHLMLSKRVHKDPARFEAQEFRQYFESVVGAGKVTHLFLNVNDRLANYPSEVLEPYWDCVKDPAVKTPQWVLAHKDAVDRGIDFVQIGCEVSRAHGAEPWLSIRMNDIHFVDDPAYHSNIGYWKRHPELWLDPASVTNGCTKGWWQRAYDYRKEPVQARMLAFIAEALARYDVDGVELDWMRFEYHVPRETARGEGAEALNRFMRRAKAVVDEAARRRGHAIRIAARVDSDPVSALNHGTDYRVWAKEGLMDWLIPCNFFATVDFELPFRKWEDEVKAINPKVLVIPGLDSGLMPNGNMERRNLTVDNYAAWGDKMYAAGAKGAYFFNLFCALEDEPGCDPNTGVWAFVTKEGFTPENIVKKPRFIPAGLKRECVLGGWCE